MKFHRLAMIALTTLSLAAAGSAHAQEKIRLGILPFSESLGAVMADKLGYFKAEGLDVEMVKINSGAQGMPLLQSGKLEIVFTNTVSTLQAIEQGMDATLIAPGAVVRTQAPDTTAALLALKGTIKTPKDLEGKRIAVNVINSSLWMYITAYMDKNGVDKSKVRFVEVPFPQMADPLLNKQVDAVGVSEPFASVLLDTGKVDSLAYPYVEAQPNGDITQYLALTDWVRKNTATATKFARAVAKGSEFVNASANIAATREANMAFTNLAPALKDRVLIPRMGTAVNTEEILKTQALLLKYGMMKKPVDIAGRVLAVK
jgi:NitT/TauT family transport system substrate-binding protein